MKNLSESQLRSITSVIHVVEEKLRDMEALVYFTIEHPQECVEVTLENDLTKEDLLVFQELIASLKQILKKISDTYQIGQERRSLRNLINTKAVMIWEDITGADFDRLKGYGEVDETLRFEYESLFNQLTDKTNELFKTIKR